MVELENITMICEGYSKIGNKWIKTSTNRGVTDTRCITSMLNGQVFLQNMGGKAKNTYTWTQKFGQVVSKIDVTAANGIERCKYRFDYRGAHAIETYSEIQCNTLLQGDV